MKFCSITPVKNADLMYEQDYVMLLAHLSQKYPRYTELARSHNNYKIMDNSIIELGSAFDMQSLVDEAVKCNVDEIILPDVFQNGAETVKSVKESINWLSNNGYLGKFKLMAVCHGKNIVELWCCFNELREIKEIDVIGVPKIISTWLDRAKEANLMSEKTDKQIHLLGCYDNLSELEKCNNLIRSMDTCLPALLSIYNLNAFDDRKGLKIDLDNDEIKINNYLNILKDVEIKLKK